MRVAQSVPVNQQAEAGLSMASAACRIMDWPSVGAILGYLGLSLIFFGRGLLGNFSNYHIGVGPDPGLMMWFFVWWPHAIRHGLNPFLSHAIWSPSGVNLAWENSTPLGSLSMAALTMSCGPVAAYNLLCLLSVALDAWCAFILCYYVTRSYWSSLLGGYVFGFSAYAICGIAYGHLPLLLVFPIPLAAYLVVQRLEGRISEYRFTALFTLALTAQFWLWAEGFATSTMFGGLALLVGWTVAPKTQKQVYLRVFASIAFSYSITLVLISPYLYYFFAYGFRRTPNFSPLEFSTDVLNFLIPTQLNEIGQIGSLRSISDQFLGGWLPESGACLSLPLIAIGIAYSRKYRYDPLAKTLTYTLVIVCVLALGPVLHVAGHLVPATLPWLLFAHLPVIDNALPSRFPMYAFLIVAIMTSLWLSKSGSNPSVKAGVAIAVIVFNLPNLSARVWVGRVSTPPFFRNKVYTHYLQRGETIITLPYGYTGDSMLWQAQTHLYFNMAEGYVVKIPPKFQKWPMSGALLQPSFVPGAGWQFRAFLEAHGVRAVVVWDSAFANWKALLSTLPFAPIKVAGVRLYRLRGTEQRGRDVPTVAEAASRFNVERFAALVAAADKYLSNAGSLASLSVLELERRKLIPGQAIIGPRESFHVGGGTFYYVFRDPHNAYGVYLRGGGADGRITVGVQAWDPARLTTVLRKITSDIYYPYPVRFRAGSLHFDSRGWLIVDFTPEQLEQAAVIFGRPAPDESSAPAGIRGGASPRR